jgi:hypothetical protein
MEAKFVNSTEQTEFKKEEYKIENTVFNNHHKIDTIEVNEQTKELLTHELTDEFLCEKFSSENPNRKSDTFALIPFLVFSLASIKVLAEKKLLITDDYYLMYLNLIVKFNDTVDLEVLDFIFAECPQMENANILKYFLNLIVNDEQNGLKLLDYLFKYPKVFANLFGYLLLTTYYEKAKQLVEKYNCLHFENHTILKILATKCTLEELKNYLSQVSSDVSHNDLLVSSIQNPNCDVTEYLWKLCDNYECKELKEVFVLVSLKKIVVANDFLKTYKGEFDEKKIIEMLKESNSLDLLKYCVENVKINYHSDNDVLLKSVIINENIEAVKYLLNSVKIIGEFDINSQKNKFSRLLRIIENEELKQLLKERMQL